MNLFKLPPSKRLKRIPSPPKLAATSSSSATGNDPNGVASPNSAPPASAYNLSADQKSRMELHRALARAKRNLKLCSEKCGSLGHVSLNELLVEETWVEKLAGEFEKPYAQTVLQFVDSEIQKAGVPIYPPQHLVFNALNTTPFDSVKVVIIGQDPYHGPGQAMGLSFSVPEGVRVPSSLVNIYKELHKDLGCSVPKHGNLERWAVQGVLLLNAVLTVRQHQANSHANKGWEQFTDAVIKTISQERCGVVFLLWGNYAQSKARLIDETKHSVLKCAHPSGLSANRGFFGCRHFSKTNQILEKMGVSPINWQL